MEWSPQQEEALRRVAAWLKEGTPQLFRLFGYAGTGKTTLARHVAEAVEGEVAFGAFTGKAASVLRQKGCHEASTIHSMIYRTRESDEGGPLFAINRSGPASQADLIVIDECSMVDAELGRDLLSFGKPVLVLGDPAQLPPVKGGGFFTDAEPDIMLTEVHRQARDNPIIRLSMTIRDGGRPGPRRPQPHAAALQRPHPRDPRLPRPDAGGGREARLPAQRQDQGPPQRRHLDGPGAAPREGRARAPRPRTGGRAPPPAGRGRRAAGVLRRPRGRDPPSGAPRVGRVHLRLRAHRPQGARVAVERRHAVRRILCLPRAPQPLALHRHHPRRRACHCSDLRTGGTPAARQRLCKARSPLPEGTKPC